MDAEEKNKLNCVSLVLKEHNWLTYGVLRYAALPPRAEVEVYMDTFFKRLTKRSAKDLNIFWFYKAPSRTWYRTWYIHFLADLDYIPIQYTSEAWFWIACRNFPKYKKIGSAVKISEIAENRMAVKVKSTLSYLKNHEANNRLILGLSKSYGFYSSPLVKESCGSKFEKLLGYKIN